MTQNSVIGIFVAVLLVFIGIWYITSMQSPANDATQGSNPTTAVSPTTQTPGAATTNTFHSIFTQTGNHQCSYEQVGASTKSSSVVYIADGKMRGEFRTTTNGINVANLMIYDGGTLYSWKEGATIGTKTPIKSLADLPDAIPQDLTSGAIFGTSGNNVSWDCHDWNKDAKLLTLPTYVKFSIPA